MVDRLVQHGAKVDLKKEVNSFINWVLLSSMNIV